MLKEKVMTMFFCEDKPPYLFREFGVDPKFAGEWSAKSIKGGSLPDKDYGEKKKKK